MTSHRAKEARMNAIYAQHFDAVTAYCLRRLPVSAANDAIAETFLVVWRKLDDAPPGQSTLPWLYRIAVRKVGLFRRRAGRKRRAYRQPGIGVSCS